MPSWEVHNKWAIKLGIDETTSKEINELIDFPKKWFKRKFIDNNLAIDKDCKLFYTIVFNRGRFHDTGRGSRLYERSFVLDCIYRIYGLAGIRAAILHYALDTMKDILNFHDYELSRERLVPLLRHKFRDVLLYYCEDNKDPNKFAISKEAEKVFKFIEENLERIVEDLR